MSERRMFTSKITESDAFLDMPLSSQALYFHLCMYADDDGFVKNPKRICKMVGVSDDDFKLLLAKSFVYLYESGIIVIKHWRMHNLLRKDRYLETEYVEEKSSLYIKENGAYTFDETQGKPLMATKWQPNGNQMATQDSIGKDRLGKDRLGKDSIESIAETEVSSTHSKPQKEMKHKHGDYQHVLLTDKEYSKLAEDFGTDVREDAIKFLDEYIEEKGYKSKSHNMAIRRWVIEAVVDRKTKQRKGNTYIDTINNRVNQVDDWV